MSNFKAFLATFVVATLLITSCKKDKDPVIPNEEEVITTLKYTLTPAGGGTPVVLSFQDLDGDGGNAPVITGGTLEANQTYTGDMVLLNEQENPVDNITEEIHEENKDHQFFFQTTIPGIKVSYTDSDADGHPVGLQTTLKTGDAGSGMLKITLRHQPDKSATGVPQGEITNAGGETDIEVEFDVTVQ
ncbi:MAG TPA: hypothetical protein ENK85_05410 [Saprospiraceae bacterium]|nr:hypothetical protein [Saprospiraceae bacterium]